MRRSRSSSRRDSRRRGRRFADRSAQAEQAAAKSEAEQKMPTVEGRFHPVVPLVLNADGADAPRVYLRQGDRYALYASEKERFSDKHREQLTAKGIRRVYVNAETKYAADKYVEANLESLLKEPRLQLPDRAELLYDAARFLMRRLFEYRLPDRFDLKDYRRVAALVSRSAAFLDQAGAYKAVAAKISRDYTTWSHSVQVFYYAVGVLKTYGQDVKELSRCGLGALLHDIGKCTVPQAVLNKPENLSEDEWALVREHPLMGAAQASLLPLPPEALKCILFHHERMDGQGYPCKLKGERIPLVVRVVAVCDAYDAMASHRPFSQGTPPVEALRVLREDQAQAYDQEVVRRLGLVLKAVGAFGKPNAQGKLPAGKAKAQLPAGGQSGAQAIVPRS